MKNHEPKQTTIVAIEEGRRIIEDSNTPSCSTMKELMTELDK